MRPLDPQQDVLGHGSSKSTDETSQLPAPSGKPSWGRNAMPTTSDIAFCASVMAFCPLLVIFTYIALEHHNGSFFLTFKDAGLGIYAMVRGLLKGDMARILAVVDNAKVYLPKPSWSSTSIYLGWLVIQGILFAIVPTKMSYGEPTPAGHTLPYKTNGMSCWVISNIAFIAASYFGLFNPAIIANHWGGLIVVANVYGYLLTIGAYIKAHVMPTHAEDRKFSGSWIYDIYFGIELNPRIGDLWDFKLFHNGRPGIVAWTIIFSALHYQNYGYISNALVIVNLLQTIYVVDFFLNENWYLKTIDIAHDHFGFYLAWGDSVWLPTMYTLQAQYLSRQSHSLSTPAFIIILTSGLAGYTLFRLVNNQKDLSKRTKGDCIIWGEQARTIPATYTTSDGKVNQTFLLCSGFWGVARHANYFGDLVLAFAMCAACGIHSLLPYTYFFFLLTLLLHRCRRDDARCSGKYGKAWDEYKRRVPYTLLPGIW